MPVEISDLAAAARHVDTVSGSCRMRWRIWGSGPRLVLIHGNAGSWLHWIRNLEFLSSRYEVIVPDLPGFGDSELPQPPFSSLTLAGITLDGLHRIAPDDTLAIAAFSMGGTVAVDLAGQLGPRLRSLVLLGAGRAFGVPSQAVERRRWRAELDPAARLAAHRFNLHSLMLGPDSQSDDLAVHAYAQAAEGARLRFEHERSGDRLHGALASLQTRVTGVWGEADRLMGPYRDERVQLLRSAQPQAELIFLPGAGHWVQFERADEVNRILARVC